MDTFMPQVPCASARLQHGVTSKRDNLGGDT